MFETAAHHVKNYFRQMCTEVGYAYAACFGMPVVRPHRPASRSRTPADPPPAHPERLVAAPPTPVEQRLWTDLTATR